MTNSKDLSRRDFIKAGSAAAIGFMLLDNVLVEASTKASRPNILWITSEDNSAYFTRCYGNNSAVTPNIDKLAKRGVFIHACLFGVARLRTSKKFYPYRRIRGIER